MNKLRNIVDEISVFLLAGFLLFVVGYLIYCWILVGTHISNRPQTDSQTTFENGREVERFWYEGYITTKTGDGWAEIIFENVPEN